MTDQPSVVGVDVPVSDAWSRTTADLTPAQYQSFCLFVARVDPIVPPSDGDRLYALRVTWAFHHDPTGYPRR